MIISVPKEMAEGERRVALVPETVSKLAEKGLDLRVETEAGAGSNYPDSLYELAGAEVVSRSKLFSESDIVLSVQTPPASDLQQMKAGSTLVCLLWAMQNPQTVDLLNELKITALGMEAIPRISRAQSMDVLSSMSSISGYKAALMGANELDRYLPMMMTAAGTIAPARVLVLGAGVAGLQAIATSKRLGAVVEAFDIRPAVKEQVESLGAKFVEVTELESAETKGGYAKELAEDQQQRQRQVIHEHAKKADIIITTALIPGKAAPLLITSQMVQDMHPGAVIVDLAAEQGGNCELTEPGTTTTVHKVKIVAPLNLPSTMAHHASQLYSKNMLSLLKHLLKDSELQFDFEDEITLNTTITHQGKIISPILANP